MKQRTHKVFYAAHTWLGVIAGLLLFVVAFSGFPAMFAHQLENWQSPALNALPAAQQVDFERLLSAGQASDFGQQRFFLVPETDHGYAMVARFGGDDSVIRYVELEHYQPIDIGGSQVAHIFEHLHTDLHLPKPFGRYLVGLAGMVMLLSIIAGIVIHTKWRQQFVMLRPKRSWRLLLTDQHKLLGLWTLPFSFILAFTGTILGLLGLISPILAVAKFDGDVPAATAAVLGPQAQLTQQAGAAHNLNQLYRQALKQQPELDLSFIEIEGYGDQGGTVKFSGNHQHALSSLQSVTFRLSDGSLLHELNGAAQGPFQRIFSAVVPLHYVQFGDIALKVFYALATLALCALIISGNMIWLAKKQQRQARHNDDTSDRPQLLARLTLGICGALVISCAITLGASQWLIPLQLAEQQHHIEEGIFWSSWFIAIWPALFGHDLHARSRGYLATTAVALLLVVISDALVSGRHLLMGNDIVLGVHSAMIALALVCGYFAWRLPQPHRRRAAVQNEDQDKDNSAREKFSASATSI